METLKKTLLLATAVFLMSCEKDDNLTEPQADQEIITTVQMVFSSQNGLDDEYLIHRVMNGEDPEIILPDLFANTTYDVQIFFLNENPVPADSINQQIISEGDKYQVFINFDPQIGISKSYKDADIQGNPVGLEFQIVTGDPGAASMNLQLRTNPDKDAVGVRHGDTANAGGEVLKEINIALSME